MEQDIDTKAYFTFDYESEGKNVTLRFNKQDPRVPDVLEEFLAFLKACGYCFDINDYLDVNNDFNYPPSNNEEVVNEDDAETREYKQYTWTMTDSNMATGGTMADTEYPEPETTNFSFDNFQNSNIFEWDSNTSPDMKTFTKKDL